MSDTSKEIILVVDDDSMNLTLAQKMLSQQYRIAVAKSGELALMYLEKNNPSLILLDINMPGMDGFKVISKLKSDPLKKAIPVIFLTADKDSETEKRCFLAGAVDFVTKPFIPEILLSRVERTLEIERYRKNLEDIVEERTNQISQMQQSVIIGMANIIENRDGSTGTHVKNTQKYVKMIVKKLISDGIFPELDEQYGQNIVGAAPLHDIGKIRISDTILLKPGKLTDEEYNLMKQHTTFGEEIINEVIRDVEDKEYTQTAVEIALSHHERWDGKGYPRGISGDEIPLAARIMAVADVFDALYAERCYKDPIRPVEKVLGILKDGKNTQFDGRIVDAFVDILPQIKAYVGE